MSKKTIRIEEACDSFTIVIVHEDGLEERFHFDQEDDKTSLVDVFEKLGFKTKYEEAY